MKFKTAIKKVIRNLEKFFNRSKIALLTAVAAAGAFMAVDGILGILPETFGNVAKIIVGVGIVVSVSWLFPGIKKR